MPSYIRHLPGTASKIIDEKTLPPNNVFFNPSIAYPIIYIRRNEHFKTKEVNSVFLYNIDTKQNYTIPSPSQFLKNNVNLYTGIEDLRICWYKDLLWFSGTCTHVSDNMTSELCVGHFNKELTCVERMSYVDLGVSPVKNVCPFVVGDDLLLFDMYLMAIYKCYEVNESVHVTIVSDSVTGIDNLSLDDKTDKTDKTEKNEKTGKWLNFAAKKVRPLVHGESIKIDGYRGSTSPVHLHGNTWGVIVHDIIFNDQAALVTRLSYLHIWLEFDVSTGEITFVSTPFWVAIWGIEYVSGIRIENDNVTLFMGINDISTLTYTTTVYNLRVGK